MNIWIVNPYDNLPLEGNRAQRYWLMARAFVRAGHRVVYWTSDFSHARKGRRRVLGTGDGERGIELVLLPALPYPKNVCWARVRSHRQLARDFFRLASADSRVPDVVIASVPPLGLCEAARRVARKLGAAFVADVQDAWPETFERILPRFVWTLLGLRRAARRIYCEADGVSAVASRYVKLAQSYGSQAPMRTFGHCIDGAKAAPRKPGDRLRLAYVGNMSLSYDLETVIRAVAGRDDVTLDVAGNGPDRERLERLGAVGNVRFHGYLDEADLAKLLASCDVGLIPMHPESCVGVPGKLADYAAAGLRVVESLGGECQEIVQRHGVGVHYQPGDGKSLLSALERVRSVGDSADWIGFGNAFDANKVMAEYVGWVEGLSH